MLWDLLAAAENGGSKNGGGSGLLPMLLPLILIGGVFYFLIIRPQQKQRRDQQTMIGSLRRGDQVVTIGGVHGRIEGLKDKDKTLVLKVAENVKIEINRASVAQVVKRRDEEEGGLQDAQ